MVIQVICIVLLWAVAVDAESVVKTNSLSTNISTKTSTLVMVESDVDYWNPFTFTPAWLVITISTIGAVILMAVVLSVVAVMRNYVLPNCLSSATPYTHNVDDKTSITDSHMEIHKQDSLEEALQEMDNDTFLASLENVNISIISPEFSKAHSKL